MTQAWSGLSRWLGDDTPNGDLTETAVRRYREDLADNDKSASTIGNHLSVIRSFCHWAMIEDLRSDDPTCCEGPRLDCDASLLDVGSAYYRLQKLHAAIQCYDPLT
jgi:hypothetical protein